jgi:hypothetical protein
MAKKKEMNRTSGVAGRKLGRSEGIATKLKYGAPLTGSASGVKSISLKDAGEVLTQGIFSVNRKGLTADPASLAMALPVGKLVKAAKALRAAGRIEEAAALGSRVLSKTLGKGKPPAPFPTRYGSVKGSETGLDMLVRSDARKESLSVFPRSAGSATKAPTLRDEYKAVKQGYEQVFGKGSKVSSFNPDVATMTRRPGSGGSAAKIRKISNQVDAYLKKRGGKTIGK